VRNVITVSELREMLRDRGIMKELPLSKVMIDFIVELIKNEDDR
jgi:hypothetical protein